MGAIQLFIDDTTTDSKYSEDYCTNTLRIQRYKENHIMMRDAVIVRIAPVIVHPLPHTTTTASRFLRCARFDTLNPGVVSVCLWGQCLWYRW